MAIWALDTGSDGKNVPSVVPAATPSAAMQLMSAAWGESSATSEKGGSSSAESSLAGQVRSAALHAWAMNVAIWPLVTGSDGEKVLADTPRITPRADMQSMPDVWAEPAATSSKYAIPVDGQLLPAALHARAMNVAIWALDTGSDGEKVLAVTPSAVVLATEVPTTIPSLPACSTFAA